ncbi:MAG: SDR family NAD(P)-dependent oxidoreductase [Sandaracinaceae bacterium]
MSNSMKDRYGPWALVAGATSGIGRALVEQLARQGMNLVTVARTVSKLEAQADSLRSAHGVEVLAVGADLSAPDGVDTIIEATAALEVGLVVPCAAIEHSGHFVARSAEEHRRMIEMNCVAPMRLAHHFGARMAARRRGAILFVSSLSGWMSQPYMASYGATKAYVHSLGEALHQEMKDHGVEVAVLSPGPTDTPMAAETGIDFASMGMVVMTPDVVARTGLAALGRRANAVPGLRNRMMAFMMTRLVPRGWVGAMFRWMLGRALGIQRDALPLSTP